LAPFVCERDSRLAEEHPDWLLHDAHGNAVRAGFHWSGSYALDTLHPEARAYVRDVLRTVVREWGFGLLKLDFLYAACMVPHDGLNRGELMADAMDLLREAAGPDALLLGCGVPLASAFGVVDYCRIGCDVGLDWDDKPHMRLLHRERVSTKNSLGNTVSRAPLDGRAFGNDPDVFFLRDDVKFSARHRRELLETDARCGSMLLTSDDMGAWGTAERELFQAAVRTLLSRKR
jgi:alpha-galactosidase